MGILVIVSSKGISNGLSGTYNDGNDFGSDTENTETFGMSEAMTQGKILLLKGGRYLCRKPSIVKSGTTIIADHNAVIVNEIKNKFDTFIEVEGYTYVPFINIDASGGSGVSIGTNGNNNIFIGYMKIFNAGTSYIDGKGSQTACRIRGYNTVIDHLDIFLGNLGIDIMASDLRIQDLQVVNCSTGMTITASNNINIGYASLDSCYYTGIQIDSSKNVRVKWSIWNNDIEYPKNKLKYGLLVGRYTKGRDTLLDIDMTISENSGTGIRLENTQLSRFNLVISSNNGTGIEYGKNVYACVNAVMHGTVTEFLGSGGYLNINGMKKNYL